VRESLNPFSEKAMALADLDLKPLWKKIKAM